MHTSLRCGGDALYECIFPTGKPAAVSDHAGDRTHSAPQIDMARVHGPWFLVLGPSGGPTSPVRVGTKDQGQGTDEAPRTKDKGLGDAGTSTVLFFRSRSTDRDHRIRDVARGQKRPDLDEARQEVPDAETRHRTAHVI